MVSSIILDPHPIIKQADVMENATSNAAGGALDRDMYQGV